MPNCETSYTFHISSESGAIHVIPSTMNHLSWPNSELQAEYTEVDTDLREALAAVDAKKRILQQKQKAFTQQQVTLREVARKRLRGIVSQQVQESKQLQNYAVPSVCFDRDGNIIRVTLRNDAAILPPFTATQDHVTPVVVGKITLGPDNTIESMAWNHGFSFLHQDTCQPHPTAFVDNTQPNFKVPTFHTFTRKKALAKFLTSPDLGNSDFEWSAGRLVRSIKSESQTISATVHLPQRIRKHGIARIVPTRQLNRLTRYAFSVTATYVALKPTLLIVPPEVRAMLEVFVGRHSIPLSNDLQFLIIEFVFGVWSARMFRELHKLRPRPRASLKKQKK